MIRRGKMGRLDWKILLLALALCSVGLLNVYSGTRVAGMAGVPLFAKQLIWICLGILAFFAFYLMSDGFIEEIVWPVFWGVLAVLVVVLVIGKVRGGAQRWISIGAFNFQPSEFAKVAVILALAKLFTDRYHYGGIGFKDVLPAIGLTILPFVLVALQPDLGTAGVFMIILLGMIVVACVKGRVLLFMGAAGILAVPGLWFAMKDYQRQRVLTFLDPERDPMGAGYHIIQSKIAVGSGQILGKGYLKGTQSHLRFLPERHTDFIFSVLSEEWGFLGALAVLVLFLFLVLWGLDVAARARDTYGRLLAV